LRNQSRQYLFELMATGTHHEHQTHIKQTKASMSDGRELYGSTEDGRIDKND